MSDADTNQTETNANDTSITLRQAAGTSVMADAKNISGADAQKLYDALATLPPPTDGNPLSYQQRVDALASKLKGITTIASVKLPTGIDWSAGADKLNAVLKGSGLDPAQASGTLKALVSMVVGADKIESIGQTINGVWEFGDGFTALPRAEKQAIVAAIQSSKLAPYFGSTAIAGVSPISDEQARHIAALYVASDVQYHQKNPTRDPGALDTAWGGVENAADSVSRNWIPAKIAAFFSAAWAFVFTNGFSKPWSECYSEALKEAEAARAPENHVDLTAEQRARQNIEQATGPEAHLSAAQMLEAAGTIDGYDTKKLAEMIKNGGGIVADANGKQSILNLSDPYNPKIRPNILDGRQVNNKDEVVDGFKGALATAAPDSWMKTAGMVTFVGSPFGAYFLKTNTNLAKGAAKLGKFAAVDLPVESARIAIGLPKAAAYVTGEGAAHLVGTREWSAAHSLTAERDRLEARRAELEVRKAELETELEVAREARKDMGLKSKLTNRDAYNANKALNGRTGRGGVNGELRKVNEQLDPLAEVKAEKEALELKKTEQAKALQQANDQGATPAEIRKAEANLRKTETSIEKTDKKLNKTTNWRGKPVEVGVEAKASAAEKALAEQRAALEADSVKAKRLAMADRLHGAARDVLDDGIIRTAKARLGGTAAVVAEPVVSQVATPEPSPTSPAPAAAKAPEPVAEAKRPSPWTQPSQPRPVAGRPGVTVEAHPGGNNITRVLFPASQAGATASLDGGTAPAVANDVGHTQLLNQGNLAVKPQVAHAETAKVTMIDASKVGQGAANGQALPQPANVNANAAPQTNATPQAAPKAQPVTTLEPVPEVEITGKPGVGKLGAVGAFGAPIIGGVLNGALAASNEQGFVKTAQAVGVGAADGILPGITSGFKNVYQNNEKQNWVDQLLNGGATATQGVAVGAGVAAVATSWTGIGALGGGAIAAISGATSLGIGLIHDATYQAGLSKQGGLITGLKDTGEAFSHSKKGEGVKGWWSSHAPTWLGGASAAAAPHMAADANAQLKQQVGALLGQMDNSQTSQKIFHHAHANVNEIIAYLEKNNRLDEVKRLAANGLNGGELQRELLASIGMTQQAFVQEKQQMQQSLDGLHQAVAEATMRAKAAAAGGAMKAHDVKLGAVVAGSGQPHAHPVGSRTAGVVMRAPLQQA